MTNPNHPARSARPDPAERVAAEGRRIAQELDPRLADVWGFLFEADLEPDELEEQIGWLLRMAYVRGYADALAESRPGSLFRSLGLSVPPRSAGEGREIT